MTAHELARILLDLPDKQVYVEDRDYTLYSEVQVANIENGYVKNGVIEKTPLDNSYCATEIIVIYGF